MTMIYVDADACPVREEVFRVAGRMRLRVFIVHNGSRPIRPPEQPAGQDLFQIVLVPDQPDAADDWIAERIRPGDICVTADIPLAKRCLDRGARALGPTGLAWTGDNIGAALAGRDLARHLRETGAGGGGHAPMGRADRSRFLSMLDVMVTAALRDPAASGGGARVPG